ncbi:MAG: MBOAT family protein [Ruminococcus sp.]|nr:MBOAT family protein [Ruminococcus sp.]
MVFSRLFFIYIFLPLCLSAYFIARGTNAKNNVLIFFSLVFYAWGEPVYIFLMLFSAAVNYLAGRLIGRFGDSGKSRLTAGIAIFTDIALLGVFKYSGFIMENINSLFSASLPVPDIRLPIGISFYTFQTISYVVDCLWETVTPQKSFRKFLLYISLFPQLVAGPIVRYSTIEKEIEQRHSSVTDISYGLNRVILGLAKKVIIADQLSTVADSLLGGIENATAAAAWAGAAVYALQIYFDFSGYSDIAIGLGRVFGFHFDENFRHPFMCKDITEFWQRWHISLGTFFRDYLLYVPIFGKRRKYGGLFLVWLCTGIWHGASWNFVIWGLYYGLFIFIETLIGKKRMKRIPLVIRHIYSKAVIIVGFGIFYFEDLGKLGTFFRKLFSTGHLIGLQDKILLMNNLYLLILAVILSFPIISGIQKLSGRFCTVRTVSSLTLPFVSAALLLLSSVMLVDQTSHPFLYFRF